MLTAFLREVHTNPEGAAALLGTPDPEIMDLLAEIAATRPIALAATPTAAQRITGCADKEYRDQGIRVVGLSPGTVATDMQVKIRESGVNPVSKLDPSVHIPADWVAQAIGFLCGPEGGEFAGRDFSLKTNEGRARAGLPPVDA